MLSVSTYAVLLLRLAILLGYGQKLLLQEPLPRKSPRHNAHIPAAFEAKQGLQAQQ